MHYRIPNAKIYGKVVIAFSAALSQPIHRASRVRPPPTPCPNATPGRARRRDSRPPCSACRRASLRTALRPTQLLARGRAWQHNMRLAKKGAAIICWDSRLTLAPSLCSAAPPPPNLPPLNNSSRCAKVHVPEVSVSLVVCAFICQKVKGEHSPCAFILREHTFWMPLSRQRWRRLRPEKERHKTRRLTVVEDTRAPSEDLTRIRHFWHERAQR